LNMKRTFTQSFDFTCIWIAALAIMMHSGLSAQTTHTVTVGDYVFTPAELHIAAGDEVVWNNTSGSHNVNGTQTTYPSNPESFGNNVGTNWTFSHVFTLPGTYDYRCDPHIAFGMVGKIIVEEAATATLTVNFSNMTPHVGQMLSLFVRELSSGEYLDTVVLEEIPAAEFTLTTHVIEQGGSYMLDFYADHNGNGVYDSPPVDHAWRLETGEAMGDVEVEFIHNTEFTDIFGTTGTGTEIMAMKVSLFPNPARDQFYIASGTVPASVSIFSVTGTRLRTVRNIHSSEHPVSLAGIGAGVYFVEVTGIGGARWVGRLVIR